MTPTMRVRELTAAERHALRRGLKAADGFTVRRCQVLLASAGGAGPAAVGATVGLSAQAVRNAIRAFHAHGLACPARRPPVATAPALVWGRRHDGDLKDLLHRRPRESGKPTSLWTLSLAAEVCHAEGWTTRRLTAEGMRGVLARLGIGWKRAKHWITSPDPDHATKKSCGTG
jgi:transposase